MTEFALIVREPVTGRVKFDSRQAVGGVCLGLYVIPDGGRTLEFPSMGGGLVGIVVRSTGHEISNSSYTYEGGIHPVFRFQRAVNKPVALFVK